MGLAQNLEAERSREAEEARSRLEIAENETRSWQRQHEEATQRIQQLREERKKADEEHAEKSTAASEKSEKLERDIEVLRKELRESEVRLQNESRERAALARALHAAEDRLGSSELQASQLRADLDEICRENSELKDRYMTAGERFERLMESEEEHTKELTRQLEEEVRAAREKADRYKSKLQKSQSELEQLRDSLSREQSKTREREREVDRLMRMVEDERTAKEKTLAELSREDTMPLRVHEQIVADMRHQAAQQLDDKERSFGRAMATTAHGENDRLKDDKRQLQEHITTLVDKLEKVDRQRQLLEGKVDEVTDQLERNKEMYTVEMNRGLQYQGEVSRLQRVEHRQEQQVDDLKAEVLRLRQTHSDAEKILQENSRLKGEVTSLTDTVKAVEQQRVEDGKQIQALQEDLRGEKVRSSRLGQAAATAVSRLDEQVRALRPDLLALRSDASTDLARTADWITARLRELASEFGSATYLQLTRHAVMLEDVSSRLEESQNRGAKLREEVKGLRAASEQRGEELASLRSKESAARAELAAAREHIAAMVGMMDRIMKMPDGDKMGEELADALGKSDTFRHVLSRYDGRVTRRVSALIQEAQGEADALAASCLELEYRCKKAEAEFRNQASVRSSLETMATQRSAELEGALERAKVLEGRCRDLEKSAEEAQAEFHDKLHTAVRRTKDALRAEIDELQAQMLDLRRQFEVEVARVSEEAAARAAAFKRRCEEKFSDERKRASMEIDSARREKERLEKEKNRMGDQLHAVEKELSRVLAEKQELDNETQLIRRALNAAEKRLEKDEDAIRAKDDQVAKLSESRSSEISRLRKTISEQNGELEHLKGQARKARESRDSIYRIISQTAGRHGIGRLLRHDAVHGWKSTCLDGADEFSWFAAAEPAGFGVGDEEPDGFAGPEESRRSPVTPPRRRPTAMEQPPAREPESLSHSVALSAPPESVHRCKSLNGEGRSEISRAVSVQLDRTRRTLEQLKSAERSSR
ncbi:hypothetical protein FOZ60_006720 [Perkinsus olseni]|uniref:Uncharacterized protein n=1 Tax=Perkinsus olseni TaxID=32597 RepID=A0A7J6PGI2_PEROL|nr:hypothetical protein FOZ60_006720 [Perkinsus olseni]